MIKTLQQLKDEATALGLVVKEGARKSKAVYLSALKDAFLMRDYPDGSAPYQELMPMLSFPYWDLSADERERLWRDQNDWLVQEKINGCRVILHFVRDVGVYAHSRNVDSTTYRFTDLSGHLIFGEMQPGFNAVLDSEATIKQTISTEPFTPQGKVIHPSLQAISAVLALKAESARKLQVEQAPIHFSLFDIPFWERTDLRQKKLCERLPYLSDAWTALEDLGIAKFFSIPPTQLHSKRTFFDQVLAKGGEGVMLKRLNSSYQDNSRRDRKGWIKVKRSIELDAFVSGFEAGTKGRYRGKVATLLFSVQTEEGPHLVAKVSSISKRGRANITLKDKKTGEVSLHPEMFGKVAHLVGQELTPKSLRLLHPRVLKWDKIGVVAADRCRYSMQSIRSGQMLLPLIRGDEGASERIQ